MTQDIAGKRILVTGGFGFVGSHIIDALLAQASLAKAKAKAPSCTPPTAAPPTPRR